MIKDKGGQDGEGVRMGVFFFWMQDAGCKRKVKSYKSQVTSKRKKEKR